MSEKAKEFLKNCKTYSKKDKTNLKFSNTVKGNLRNVSPRRNSNPRPTDYKSVALAN